MAYGELGLPTPPDSDSDLDIRARNRLKELAEGPMVCEQIGENLAYGNSDGLAVLQSLRRLESAFDQFRDETQSEIYRLKQASKSFRAIRKRFLAKVLDGERGHVDGDQKIANVINEGNMVAHHGDAIGDALVYEEGGRTDPWQYEKLYGMSWQQILELGKLTDWIWRTFHTWAHI